MLSISNEKPVRRSFWKINKSVSPYIASTSLLKVASKLSPTTNDDVMMEEATNKPAIINAAWRGLRRTCCQDNRNTASLLGENIGCNSMLEIIPVEMVQPQVEKNPISNQSSNSHTNQASIIGPM